MSYGIDLRKRVVEYVQNGGGKAEAARRFGVSRGRVYQWMSLGKKLTTGLRPGPTDGHKVNTAELEKAVNGQPDILQTELAKRFAVDTSTICRSLKKLGYTRKKNVGLQRVVTTSKAPQKIYQNR